MIVLTGQNDRANALRAVGLGAYDFFAKPFEIDLLGLTIERAFRLHELQQENRRLQMMQQPDALAGLITRDPAVLRICRTVEKVAASNATVLHSRRKRHRQGTHRARAHTAVAAAQRTLRRDQLRRDSRKPARKRAVRLREGRLHRRRQDRRRARSRRPTAAR